jgi:hypothetical protein
MSDSIKKYEELKEDGKFDNVPEKEHFDLKTLQYIRLSFELYSDSSTNCLGYRRLLELVRENGGSTEIGDYRPYTKFDL